MIINENVFKVFFNNHSILYSNFDRPPPPRNVDPTIAKMYKIDFCLWVLWRYRYLDFGTEYRRMTREKINVFRLIYSGNSELS